MARTLAQNEVAVDRDEYAALCKVVADGKAAAAAEIDVVRREAAAARADLVTSLTEAHQQQVLSLTETQRATLENVTTQYKAALEQALASLAAREAYAARLEERVEKEIGNRQKDVFTLGTALERQAQAEYRDARAYMDDRQRERDLLLSREQSKVDAELRRMDRELAWKGFQAVPFLISPFLSEEKAERMQRSLLPVLAQLNQAQTPGPHPALPESTGPAPLCRAIAECVMAIRSPELVDALAVLLLTFQGVIPEQASIAFRQEVPRELAAVAAAAMATKATIDARLQAQTQPSPADASRVNGSSNVPGRAGESATS